MQIFEGGLCLEEREESYLYVLKDLQIFKLCLVIIYTNIQKGIREYYLKVH